MVGLEGSSLASHVDLLTPVASPSRPRGECCGLGSGSIVYLMSFNRSPGESLAFSDELPTAVSLLLSPF